MTSDDPQWGAGDDWSLPYIRHSKHGSYWCQDNANSWIDVQIMQYGLTVYCPNSLTLCLRNWFT